MLTALAAAPLRGTTAPRAAVLGDVPCTAAAAPAVAGFTVVGRPGASGSAARLPSADRSGPFPVHPGHAG